MILVHVDDFLAAGSDKFENTIMIAIMKKFCFGRVSVDNFTYTGISIQQSEKRVIYINQNVFFQNLPFQEYSKKDPEGKN